MFRSATFVTWFVLCAVYSAAGEPPASSLQPGAAARPEQANDARRVKGMRDKLANPVTLENGLADNTALRDALGFISGFISDRHDVTILVATQAFKAEGVDAVEDQPVKLPKMIGVKLGTVLRLLAEQVNGAYLIHPDFIEVVPVDCARPESWRGNRHLAPTITAEFSQSPLADALQQLADSSGISIIVDGRAAEKTKTRVTATLSNVPIDTAVLILADMAELRPVALNNLLYVTTKENAEDLKAWLDQQGTTPKPESAGKPK
jgi:hypothetical protein